MNKQKGAIAMSTVIGIVIVLLIIIGVVWYMQANPSPAQTGTQTAPTTTEGGVSSNSSVTTNASGEKVYSNFKYSYAVAFPPDAQYSISNPDNVSFSFKSGTTIPDGTLKITAAGDVTHLAYCLTVPQGASGTSTTTINGAKFLSYSVSANTAANTGTTYYRLLHIEKPYGNLCYDIQKSAQGSATLNSKLNAVLQSFTFITP